ncbi:Endo-1,4-beta-xylanase [Phytophthora ramorum]|uniref:Endo-1,4-beta-xylanase n=1 Tax=Phytophthora ramorum TaxID=164328 RepID=UPI0030AC4AF3|nr:Endo-1,4-beta-xylanase [Phytophthora ramorum]
MSELSKPPQKKINWLKRLNLALDDDDSSDATPQSTDPERTHKKQQKKTPVKARRDDEDGGVAVDNSIRKRKDGSGHVKDNGEEPEARRRPQKQNKSEERRKRSHHGSGSENRLEKSRTPTTVGGMDEDGGHQTKPKEQAGKMTHRKRYHAEMATKDKTDQGAVDLKPEVSVDPAKAKAAASRQRRMRKLQARRKATGEHDRLTAIKLKRHDLLKASRIKRNQRRNTGKAIAAANKNCDVKDEVLAGPRHSSSEEAKERKRMLERQRRAALKAKKELAAQSNVSSLSKHSLSADRPPNWQKRQEELRRALGAKPRVLSEEGEPSQKRHKMQLERKDASVKVIKEPALETASKISPVKSPLSNNSEARSTDKSKVGQVKIVEFQQIAKQNGEGEKGGVHTPIPPKRVTNGGVKPELDSVNTCSNQTEGADLSGGQEEPERKQDHVVKTEIQEEGQVSSPALVSGVSGETTEPQSGNEKKASDEKEGMLLDMMPIPRKAFKRGPPAENAASFVIPKRSTNGQADDHPASRATNPPEAPIPVLTKLLPSPKSSPHYSIRDPIRSQRKRKKNPVPVKKSMLSAEDRALMRLGRKRNSIFMAVSELAFQPSPCEGSKKMSTTRMMGYEVLGIDGIALPDLIPRLSCATRREMASAKDSFDSPFFGVSLSIPKAKGDNCSTVDECAGGVHKMSCYEKLEFERPEDRDFYQRRMYGTTFTPQRLRGRTTLIVRNTRFERKSTGIRFNQDRDREEFAASLSKRYTFNKSVPRCTIPRENWQKLTRNQLSTAYLHYYNREDAERASHAFYDDLGNPLELRLEYKAGVVISRSSSPAPAGRSNRAPRRSCSSERSAPEPSPLSSHGGSVRSTPHRGRERQRAANGDYRYSRYDLPPPTQFNGGDRYGSSTSDVRGDSFVKSTYSGSKGLNDLAKTTGRYMGTATDIGELSDTYYAKQLKNISDFGMITPANAMKHQQVPSWVENLGKAELLKALENHITKVMIHFGDSCYAWDVVNEAMGDDGSYRKSFWYTKTGTEYISTAFKAASAVKKSLGLKTKLYYNDYNTNTINTKSTAVLDLVKSLITAGVEINGVGFQSHLSYSDKASASDQISNMRRFEALKLDVALTELDVKTSSTTPSTAEQNKQLTVYRNAIAVCKKLSKCVGVTIWDFVDTYTWLSSSAPLPWYQPKGKNTPLVRKASYDGIAQAWLS